MGVEISALPTATLPYDGTEVMPIVQAGETRKALLLPYKVYVALLTQTGTDAPVATVLENTLGGTVVWSYIGTGAYAATLVNAFTASKTLVFVGVESLTTGSVYTIPSSIMTTNEIQLWTYDTTFSSADGQLYNTSIEIRVYYA